jgi:aminotransferase
VSTLPAEITRLLTDRVPVRSATSSTDEIRLFHPDVGTEELAALAGVVETAWLGRGPHCGNFEREFAAHIDASPGQVLSVNSATDGFFYIAEALRLRRGDEIIVPSISFVGTAQAAAYSGATVVLCDNCPRSLNVTVEHLERARTRRSKALMLLHFGGVACDMDSIVPWCAAHGIQLVEDTACAPATRWRGRATGTFGAFAAWSFDSMKIMTAGEGGLIYAADPAARQAIAKRADMGITSSCGHASTATDRWWEFDVLGSGRRSVMGDMAAAVARVQLRRLPALIRRRREIDGEYREALADLEWLTLPLPVDPRCESSYYFFAVQCAPSRRDRLARYLRDHGIYTSFRYYPLHRTRFFHAPHSDFPGANLAADTTLCLPLHTRLREADVVHIVEAIRAFPA